jgi:HTH-type transcriptional regulator/antitoxin HipB
MLYPIKTLAQLPPILKAFRKEKALTQAAMAEKLGITQQSYASFEANPARATFERLFVVLRMLNVDISLDQGSTGAGNDKASTVAVSRKAATEGVGHRTRKVSATVKIGKASPSAVTKVARVVVPARRKENW